MTRSIDGWRRGTTQAPLLLVALAAALPAQADRWGARREFREGQREIAQERREVRRGLRYGVLAACRRASGDTQAAGHPVASTSPQR